MPGNTFGKIFKISSFGESHGLAIGVVIDGIPAGLSIDLDHIQWQMDRRRPGQSKIVTQRKESDKAEIMSGLFEGKTTGTPLFILIKNEDAKSKDYSHIAEKFRPSHADFTYQQKYGLRDYRGGGRSSARETAARVAAGAIAIQLLKLSGISVNSYVHSVGHIAIEKEYSELDFSLIDSNDVRCPDAEKAKEMEHLIKDIKSQGDTIGGTIQCVISGLPVGLGEPVFDKLHADLGKAILSINACKGFEYGSGFSGTSMKGSEHNDVFAKENNKVTTKTNYSGGIQGGISNGMDIYFKAAFKPIATIIPAQESIDLEGNPTEVKGRGRHDPCVLPRAVPIVDAMAALVIVDHLLRNKTTKLDA
jgi:chorismate synthase